MVDGVVLLYLEKESELIVFACRFSVNISGLNRRRRTENE